MSYCPYCATRLLGTETICPRCGQALPSATSAYAAPAAAYPQPAAWPPSAGPSYAGPPDAALYSQTAASSLARPTQGQQARQEKMHHWIWLGNLITIGAGGWLAYTHWHGNTGIVLGAALIALAALSLALTRFGKRWKRLSLGAKLLALPGVLAGLVALVIVFIAAAADGKSSGDHKASGDHKSSGDHDSEDNDFGEEGESGGERRRHQQLLPFAQACPRCGQMVPQGMRFCPRCGMPM